MMMVVGCNSGGVLGGEGKVDLAKKNSFLESLVKIGEGFQEIFVGFGSAVGDVLGFNVIKSDDNRSKVREHFKTIGDGLKNTKDKLDKLSKQIVSTFNADTKGVEAVIQGSSEVIGRLIDSLTKLAGAVGSISIGDNTAGAAVVSEEASVKTVIEEVKAIVEIAENSKVKIGKGIYGGEVTAGGANTNAPAVLSANAAAGAGAGSKLADEITKADSWAMIDKIKNAKTKTGNLDANASNGAGELATGTPSDANGAKAATNADLAAAVALKAMTKSGKFSAAVADIGIVKAAAASAVNKVLGILDVIIIQAVNLELDKVKEAVKGIKYSETPESNVPEVGTIQTPSTK
ncbi:variable large family protein [Borrelia crocidurae]|uniref:Variable large protein n=1 Tax=Borrelia crocidurae (strain Achema) TaxID=1155096 RepID=I0FEW6_BORCA|nr:variable large family protein [Borrelia crocidurae]AFI32022.1 VmpJ protein [Borrelia crocidurae str. Achema]